MLVEDEPEFFADGPGTAPGFDREILEFHQSDGSPVQEFCWDKTKEQQVLRAERL